MKCTVNNLVYDSYKTLTSGRVFNFYAVPSDEIQGTGTTLDEPFLPAAGVCGAILRDDCC
jgi:hypothetical protein